MSDYNELVRHAREEADAWVQASECLGPSTPKDFYKGAIGTAEILRELVAAVETLTGVLYRHGFRFCDIPACNCGSWHHVGGFAERFREIEDATSDDWCNGETLLGRVRRIAAERDALRKDAERLDSGTILTSERDEFGEEYQCLRVGLDLRAMIDEAMERGKT